ncbi:MAG: putative Se/S carrier-like protein [Clostridia bacterium]|nr:putative Se/S carrier-like protein [Clostridia bacterium]
MDYNLCTASMTSETYAIKAQKILAEGGIYSRIIRLDGERSRRGCAYAIEFPCYNTENVKAMLQKGRVRARHFYMGEKEL